MFTNLLQSIDVAFTTYQLEQLEQYFLLLKEWNKKMNLTSIIERQDVFHKHFFDSLLLTKQLKIEQQSLCDVGTGAGFPGIVLKIFFPELKLYLVEAANKKCIFLNEVVKTLELKQVTIINDRIENIIDDYREKFDIVTVRAVGKLSMILELCVAVLKVNGVFVALKANVNEEMKTISNAMNILNLKLISTYESNWEFLGNRTILYFSKQKITSLKYPRDFSKIKKLPL